MDEILEEIGLDEYKVTDFPYIGVVHPKTKACRTPQKTRIPTAKLEGESKFKGGNNTSSPKSQGRPFDCADRSVVNVEFGDLIATGQGLQ